MCIQLQIFFIVPDWSHLCESGQTHKIFHGQISTHELDDTPAIQVNVK